MATALASDLIQRVFSYRTEVMAFRQWQDSAMDISVYMLITTGIIAATTKPQPQVNKIKGKYKSNYIPTVFRCTVSKAHTMGATGERYLIESPVHGSRRGDSSLQTYPSSPSNFSDVGSRHCLLFAHSLRPCLILTTASWPLPFLSSSCSVLLSRSWRRGWSPSTT